MDRYDIAIIGTGPAGLEAAITAKVRNKRILLIGGGSLSTKVEKAHTIKNYLGKGVSYCATCDGTLYRGKSTIVIGYSQAEEKEAVLAAVNYLSAKTES